MTKEEAIRWMEDEKSSFEHAPALNGCQMTKEWQDAIDVYSMAISAIRQQEHFCEVTKKVEPLTLDELRKMDDPVWCSCETIEGGDGYWCLCKNGIIITPAGSTYDVAEIPHWVFYRQKPEEVQK